MFVFIVVSQVLEMKDLCMELVWTVSYKNSYKSFTMLLTSDHDSYIFIVICVVAYYNAYVSMMARKKDDFLAVLVAKTLCC
jgi:hypothetical protein